MSLKEREAEGDAHFRPWVLWTEETKQKLGTEGRTGWAARARLSKPVPLSKVAAAGLSPLSLASTPSNVLPTHILDIIQCL